MSKRFFIHLAYDGSAYRGWQIQPGDPTVQGTLEEALSTLLQQKISVSGAGRTDTGVHASCFYAHFDFQIGDEEKKEDWQNNPALPHFVFKLNRYLPPDIVIYSVKEVEQDMHARFSASSRTYQYRISRLKPLYNRNYAHYIFGDLNTEAITACCEMLPGIDDFTSFAKLHTDVKTNICRVDYARWTETEDEYVFEIKADRFLRNMVRSLAGTLMNVGQGKLDPEAFMNIVEAKDRSKAGQSAPARGLFLTDITYS